MDAVIREASTEPRLILFIDEIHQLLSVGGQCWVPGVGFEHFE